MEIEREANVEINGIGTKTELDYDELTTVKIEYVPEEKEYPHIIEKLDPWHFYNKNEMRVYIDKINEIIEVVNIMMRGR